MTYKLVVGFADSAKYEAGNNEVLDFVINKGFRGLDIKSINGYDRLYETNQLIQGDVRNILDFFEPKTISEVYSCNCIGKYTSEIDGLIECMAENGTMELYCVLQYQVPIIVQKAVMHFEEIQIEFNNYYADDIDAIDKADFNIKLIRRIII